jgi:Flp pilus assembly protein TadG
VADPTQLRGTTVRQTDHQLDRKRPAASRSMHRRSPRDQGYVLLLTALLLLPLVAFTGFAVDLGAWAGTASKAQSAADAAALAGVVYLPDLPAKAISVAKETARKNGYADGVNGVTVTVTPNSRNELDVVIFDPAVGQYFSGVFTEPPDITRGATAEFIRPIAMGSPSAYVGTDPETSHNPRFVLNTAGRGSNKENGDKRTAGGCINSQAGCTPANSSNGVNTDYSPEGYLYAVDVGPGSTSGQPLKIEVFDPAYTYNGDTCDQNNINQGQINNLRNNHPGDPYGNQRYASGKSTFCMGDQNLAGNSVITTYIVRAPDDTPSDLSDNPAICAISFDAYNPGGANAMYDLLNSNSTRGREQLRYRDHYRKWFPVCTVPAGQVQEGTYVLQVRTNADLSSPVRNINGGLTAGAGSLERAANPLPTTAGYNRYTLRAGRAANISTSAPASFTGISVSAVGHLPIYINQDSATAEFYLARITPETAGKTLQLIFWDMADGANSTFRLLPPADASGSPFQCTFTRDGSAPPGVSISGCQMSGITSSNYNGRNVIVRIPIPADYNCAVDDPNGCWTKVRVTFSGNPADTTTWSASMTGDPIRLIR